MNPKDLKKPFKWEDRRPLMQDGVLYVPEYYDKHQEWAPVPFFAEAKPIAVEYCTGNGAWILEKAQLHPEMNWIAVEIRFDRARKIWSKMRNANLTNLLVVCGEALTFSKYYLQDSVVQEAYINFPDPWPKEKHAKHRLIQEPFVREISRVISNNGRVVLVTDHPVYHEQMKAEIGKVAEWQLSLYTNEWPNYGTSYFDHLFRGQGCPIHYLQFENKK